MNLFPQDFDGALTGFGGDPSKNREEHRKAIRKTPVILVHGNAGHSAHPKWGMQAMKTFLKELAGYQDYEIWAMDHLGENNSLVDLNDPHRNHIAPFRAFVDQVKDYLGVKRLDFIAHSLGCGMVNGYLRGLQSDGEFDNDDHRLDVVSTFVSLAGATYGLGLGGQSEFKSGSAFEVNSHRFNGVVDDTPDGTSDTSAQVSPQASWKKVSTLDSNGIHYVAITSVNDFVDAQNRDTGRREGANLNKRFDLGGSIDGHEKIIKSQTVFNSFRDYLNQNPPIAPAVISVDKDSGSYGAGLQITVTVAPATVSVDYVAERIVKRFDGGFIGRTVIEARTGTLTDGQSLTLATNGQWELLFRAAGAEAVQRTYGVDITLPEVRILTDGTTPFRDSLDVSASTTRGTLYHSTNRENWFVGSVISINRAATVSFIAIDSDGIASPIVSRAFEKEIPWEDKQTATLTEHFIAGRLIVNQYVALGLELGFNAVITLYLVGGTWVLNPEVPRAIRSAALPVSGRSAALDAGGAGISIRADGPSGAHAKAFDVTISASGSAGEALTVYYTEDGSDPSDRNNAKRHSFDTRKTFTIRGNGRHSVLCHAQDSAGNAVFEAFAWSIDDQLQTA
jgi:pimeloyl-ACP methyl ester carboxylesterase